MSEHEPDDLERAEAEALSHALAREQGARKAPTDALQTAALLRYSAGEGELDAARAQALLDELLPAVK
jgi:hypothetical protein